MRAFEFLAEAQGGIMRRAQEVAQGKTVSFEKDGHKVNLTGTVVLPETDSRFETPEELDQAVTDALAANGNPQVLYPGNRQVKSGAALITLWADDAGKSYAMIKYANVKAAGAFPIVWTNSDFARDTGYRQTDNKIAQRAQFNLKPDKLLPTDTYIPATSIPNSIKAREDLSPEIQGQIKQLLTNVANGTKDPVAGAGEYTSTYEIDLGEVAAPIALVTGNLVSGSYKEAEDALLKPLGLTWQSVNNVLFPGSGANLIYDSYLQLGKTTSLKISSKDKKGGAAAAVTGLVKEIQENPERFKEVTEKKEYQEILSTVQTIAQNRAVNGPLMVAVQYGIITDQEMQTILQHWGKGEKFDAKTEWLQTLGIQAALKRKGAKFQDPAYDLGYHVLAGVAELVADKLNNMSGIDNFFRAILERSTMVQVKAAMSKSGDGAAFSNFTVIYPPVFTGSIKVVAGNNYMATRKPIGKISFKIG